jgi:uncharacterized protein (TIGR02598 family)
MIHYSNKLAFSLIEVVLALMVVAVGMLGVFSLFPAGLSMSKSMTDEIRASAFAEEVFTVFEAQSYVTNWNEIGSAIDVDTSSQPLIIDIQGNQTQYEETLVGGFNRVHYIYENITNYTLRYSVDIEPLGDRINRLDLKIWPGEFGPTNDVDALRFVTEIYNFRIDPENE